MDVGEQINKQNSELPDASIKFMLVEFQETYSEWQYMREQGIVRLRFLITITTFLVTALALVAQISAQSIKNVGFLGAALVAFLFLLALSWNTYSFQISRIKATDINARVLARIRRYFLDHDHALAAYLTWQIDDGPTEFLDLKHKVLLRTSSLILALNSAILAGLSLVLVGTYLQTGNQTSLFLASIFASAILLVVVYLFLQRYAARTISDYKQKPLPSHKAFADQPKEE